MSRPARFHYAWIVAVVTFLTLLATAGIRAMPAVLILPLEQEFGWNRATVSVAVSINLLVYGLIGPFAASLMDRFGLRRVIMLALTADALAVGGLLFMRSLWQLYLLWGVLVAVATGSTAIVLAATVANRWFFARRGLVMGGLTSANAMGQILFLPLLAYIAVSAGWRPVVMVTAAVAMLILPVSLAFMRDSPESIGLQPYGAPAESAASSLPPGEAAPPKLSALASLRLGVRRGDFWLLAGSFFVCGASTFGLISTHFIPASVEHGVPEVTAASLLAVMGTLNIAGTMASGWLTDRYDNRWLLCGYYLMRGIALLFLPFAYGLGFFGLLAFVVFYGLDWIATVPPTLGLSSQIFGKRNGPVVFGWMFAAHQVGSATAALGAGILRTWLGDYQLAFMSSGLLCLLAAGIVIRIGRASRGSVLPARPLGAGVPAAS